jgi:TatD DNase family protein
MNISLIDSHCHLEDDRFDEDREEVVHRAHDQGVQQFIISSTIATRWQKVKQTATDLEGVYASYGLHPMFMSDHKPGHIEELDAWVDKNACVAIGECGLDFYSSSEGEEQQLELFRDQLEVAANHQLPVIIHARKALDLVLCEIRQSSVRSGFLHSFSGSLQQAQQLIDLGFKLGIGATVSFDRAKKLRRVVSDVEVEALLIESDAPDQPGAQHRGERNEPSFILDHLGVMAELRDMTEQEMATQLSQNTRDLFNLE